MNKYYYSTYTLSIPEIQIKRFDTKLKFLSPRKIIYEFKISLWLAGSKNRNSKTAS